MKISIQENDAIGNVIDYLNVGEFEYIMSRLKSYFETAFYVLKRAVLKFWALLNYQIKI
jgi:hypothetical protein